MLVDLHASPSGRVRAVLFFDQPRRTLIELSINPVGGETPSSQEIAQILKTIGDRRFADFVETSAAASHIDWNAVMAFAACCQDAVRAVSRHVITTVRIEDEETAGKTPLEAADPAANSQIRHGQFRGKSRAAGHSFEL